jgi:hypothetical protein
LKVVTSYSSVVCLRVFERRQAHRRQATARSCVRVFQSMHKGTQASGFLLWRVFERHAASYCSGVSLRVFERAQAHTQQATAWAFSRMHKLTGVKGVFSSMHKHTGSKLLLRRLVACFRACTSTQAASYCLGL